MTESILLAWERRHELDDRDQHLNDGYFARVSEGKLRIKYEFKGWSYARMITRLSEKARKDTDAPIFLLRLEQKPPVMVPIHNDMAEMLRNDPVLYIRSTTFGGEGLKRKKRTNTLKPKPLVSGVDTLAQMFGDNVYVRVRMPGEGVFEGQCPECGNWTGFGLKADKGQYLLRCTEGCHNVNSYKTWLPIERLEPNTKEENPRYAVVSTETLLARNKSRYCLPALGGQWITHEKLSSEYNKYKKEKDECIKHNDQ